MMLLSRVIFRKYGWGVAAQITPTVLLITGVAFFALVLFSAPLTPWLATINLTPLMAAVLIGAAQNVFSKSAKYSLFDPCKEMAYIPLDQETQLKVLPKTPSWPVLCRLFCAPSVAAGYILSWPLSPVLHRGECRVIG
jgi:ATP/ADP translocase